MKAEELFQQSNAFKSAEQQILDYTASQNWEDIQYMNWTTAEMLEQMEKFAESYSRQQAIEFLKNEHDKEGLDTTGIKYDLIFNDFLKTQEQ